MTQDFDGQTLIDSAGDALGTVHDTYIDEAGKPRFLAVRMGSIIGRHHLVPADGATPTDQGVRVPFLRDVIEESPAVSGHADLQGDELSRVQDYYRQDFGGDGDAT